MTTTNPVPSAEVDDLVFNVQKLDEIVSSSSGTYVDRLGVQRLTATGATNRIAALNPRGAWATATLYQPKDLVSNSGTWYIAIDTHTSGATFAGDLTAHWRPEQGVTATDLLTSASSTKGAGQVGYGKGVAYGSDTVGGILNGVGSADNFRADLLLAGNGPWANPASGDGQHLFELVNDNSSYQCWAMSAYGIATNGNNMHWNRYHGTLAAPTAITSGTYIKSEGYRGWDGSGTLSQSMAAHQVLTTQNWTATNHGIKFHWELTKTNGSSRLSAMDLYSGASDSVILQIGDGSNLLSRLVNSGTTGGLQMHGSSDQASSQILLYGSTHASYAGQMLHRADKYLLQKVDGTELVRITGAGLGVNKGSDPTYALEVKSFGANVFNISASGGDAMLYSTAGSSSFNAGENAAAAALYVRKESVTNRSINAAGTINASGADYAERIARKDGESPMSKGQIVGLTSEGRVTSDGSKAVSFCIISTNPSFIGNDTHEFDRDAETIAFCGQVPINVFGATPGDYVVPTVVEKVITCRLVVNPTIDEYIKSIGKVLHLDDDGRAVVLVKIV